MKVQNEMSTRISVDAVSAIGSLSAFRNAIRGASDAWRAQEVALKNSGNFTEAAAARYRGLNKVIDLQKAKIDELRSRQEGLDTSNQKQANQFLKLEKQIQQANKQLASYEAQSSRARNAVRYQASGLASLQQAYRQSQEASTAFVNRLNAEHRTASATVERYRQLRSSLSNLESQYRKQDFLLKQVANDSGKSSSAYLKQKEQLDKTATSIAKTKDEMKSMQSAINGLQPTGIERVDNAVVKLRDRTTMASSRISAGFDRIKDHMFSIATTATVVGATMVSSINKAASLQKTMVENQNLMSTAGEKAAATQKEVNQMYSDGAKYSVQYGVSQKTIAEGYQELIKRGYDGRQSLGAMKSILEASRASGDDFNDTMKVTTSTLEAFGMRSETTAGMMRNTAKAADILAKGADVTSTSFKSIGEAMTYAASSAKASGVSLRETTAILGVLSNNGLEATQAGTGLQRILTRLAAPTSTATAAMKKYNLSIDDFRNKSGKLKNVNDIFKTINKNVPKADRLEFFNKVFGQTAQNAASILSRTASLSDKNSQSLAHVENQLKTAYSEDYVGKLARKNMNSAKNSEERFKYASQAIQIEIGRNMLPALSKASQSMANAFGRKDTQRGLQVIAKGLGKVVMGLADVVSFIGKHTTTVKVFGTVMLTAFAGVKLLSGIGKLRGALENLPGLLKGIGTAAKIATLGFNPWVIAIEAVVAGFTLLYKHSAKFRAFVNGLAGAAKKGMKAVGHWFTNTFHNIEKAHQRNVQLQEKQHKINERNWNNFTRSVGKTVNNSWKSITRYSKNGWNYLQRNTSRGAKTLNRNWNNFTRTIGRYGKGMWDNMKRGSTTGWHSIERDAQRGTSQVSRWYQQLNRNTQRTVQDMAKRHPRMFQEMYRLIQDHTKTWHDIMTFHWDRVGRDIDREGNDMSRDSNNIFRSMYDAINDKTDGGLTKVVNSWQKHMSEIGDAIESAKKTAGQAMADLANGVLKPFKVLVDDIQGGINWILDKIGASKLGGSWSAAIPTFATGTAGNQQGLQKSTIGMVNDGAGSHWREMYSYNGHVGLFPNKRNLITFLPKGMSILDGENSHKLMNMMGLPHFANGIGSFVDFFKGILRDSEAMMNNADKIIAHPVEFAESVFDNFINNKTISSGIKFAESLVKNVPHFIASRMGAWIKKMFEQFMDDNGTAVTASMIRKAAARMKVSVSDADIAHIMNVVMHESGNRAAIVNGWDSNAAAGHPSIGVLQFIQSTFDNYAMPGHTNIRKPFDQLLAMFNDATWRSDLTLGGWSPHGARRFANGGLVSAHGLYEVAEQNRPEMIIPMDIAKRGRAYQLLSEVMAQFKHEDSSADSNRPVASNKEQFIAEQSKLDELKQGINTMIQLMQTQIAVTKAQGKFDPRQQNIQQARALQLKLQQF